MKPSLGSWPLLFLFITHAYTLADPSSPSSPQPLHRIAKRAPQLGDLKDVKADAKPDRVEPKLPKLQPVSTTTTTDASASPTSARKQGTKDAPVDGHDGKPHEGPFVDSQEAAEKPASSKSKSKIVPEDGVMNDPNRAAPKKGTTGTEGGVSEKSKADSKDDDRKSKQIPTSPKDADAVSHTEEDQMAADEGKPPPGKSKQSDKSDKSDRPSKQSDKSDKQTAAKDSKAATDSKGEKDKPKGALSLEKPDDLPDKPHDIPIPAPASKSKGKGYDADKIASSKLAAHEDSEEEHDKDDDDDDGVHDVVRWDSFIGSLTSIAATEIGDKTFIVAALMAMRHPRLQVFSAAFSALFVMTILSGLTGHAVGAIISKRWSAILAAALFLVFGAKSLKEGMEMDPHQGVSAEIREVEAELEEKEVDMARANSHQRLSPLSPDVLESGRVERSRSRSRMSIAKRGPSASRSPSPYSPPTFQERVSGIKNLLSLLLSPAWVETFSMTFIGELGDRSQIATVAMAAGQEYFWVMVGATLGHFLCTACAVIGGSMLAGRVSMRKVTITGGVIFVGFGLFTLFEGIQYFH